MERVTVYEANKKQGLLVIDRNDLGSLSQTLVPRAIISLDDGSIFIEHGDDLIEIPGEDIMVIDSVVKHYCIDVASATPLEDDIEDGTELTVKTADMDYIGGTYEEL